MRTNLPVTGKEIMLKDGETIVSKTNLKGQITFINQAFLEISGFTEKELIGEPHNIVRHPDMPSEAYTDMWKCLKDGPRARQYLRLRRLTPKSAVARAGWWWWMGRLCQTANSGWRCAKSPCVKKPS
jgi:PAS domain-containing protein